MEPRFEGSLIYSEKNGEYLADLTSLERARTDGAVLEARALIFDSDKNLIVPLGEVRGVMPYRECASGLDSGTTRDIAVVSRVGKPVCFAITGFGQDLAGKPVAYLSRRAVQQDFLCSVVSRLTPGDIIPCRVTRVERFGCFCDVGRGITALLPADSVSYSRARELSERVRAGDELLCAVRRFDEAGRLVLTHKELLGTFEQNAEMFRAGETVTGIIRSVESYGVFVELTPNLSGLAEPRDDAEPGMLASVYIKSILPQKLKIKLAVVDVFSGEPERAEFRYFISSGHIDEFSYSPDGCSKSVGTVF